MESSRERWKALRDAANGLERLAAAEGWTFTYELKPEGTGNMEIEIREGETMAQALTRVAKAQANNHSVTDDRVTMPKQVVKSASKSPRKAVKPDNPALMAAGGKVDEGKSSERDIYSTVHVYRREGETEAKVRWNGSHEREMHGPGTLVYVHLHKFGAECDSSCRVKVEAD